MKIIENKGHWHQHGKQSLVTEYTCKQYEERRQKSGKMEGENKEHNQNSIAYCPHKLHHVPDNHVNYAVEP